MLTKSLLIALLSATTLSLTTIAHAQNDAAIDEIAGYLDLSEYGGGVIFAEQIPPRRIQKYHYHRRQRPSTICSSAYTWRHQHRMATSLERTRPDPKRQDGADLLQHWLALGSRGTGTARGWLGQRADSSRWV